MNPDATVEDRVAQHYSQSNLERKILDALLDSGKDIERLVPGDLSPVDEFHAGGREATAELAAQVGFKPNMHILDIGCGIGGPSHYFAEVQGCRVTGIDLTEDFVRTADALARRVGLTRRVTYWQASALDLPFEPEVFDGAYMMHVGMNIEDKRRLFAEIRRVLKSGSMFAIYDIMRTGVGVLTLPTPWAATPETSFVDSAAAYRRALEAAGFTVSKGRDRGDYAREFFREAQARIIERGEPPRLCTQMLMKDDAAQKIGNAVSDLEKGLIAPIELICLAR